MTLEEFKAIKPGEAAVWVDTKEQHDKLLELGLNLNKFYGSLPYGNDCMYAGSKGRTIHNNYYTEKGFPCCHAKELLESPKKLYEIY